MSALTVYSSAPATTQLACACLSLHATVRPLHELPAPASKPRPPSLSVLADELLAVTIDLALLGDQLTEHEMGRCRLDAGVEQGLRFGRDALQTRKRALEAVLKGQRGGAAL